MREHVHLTTEHRFNPLECRHYLNGQLSVLHCHHYAALYTRLASDVGFLDGKKLLTECAEDSFYEMLRSYFAKHSGIGIKEIFDLGSRYYSLIGMGNMQVSYAGQDRGEVVLHSSHIDTGWLIRMGQYDKPVNYITCGYIAALFSSAYGLPPHSFDVEESESIVTGGECSCFRVVRR